MVHTQDTFILELDTAHITQLALTYLEHKIIGATIAQAPEYIFLVQSNQSALFDRDLTDESPSSSSSHLPPPEHKIETQTTAENLNKRKRLLLLLAPDATACSCCCSSLLLLESQEMDACRVSEHGHVILVDVAAGEGHELKATEVGAAEEELGVPAV